MYLYKCAKCGSESLIASPGAMRCDCGGQPDLVSGKHHPVLCGDLHTDLKALAVLIYESAELYDGCYLSIGHSEGSEMALAAARINNEVVHEWYEKPYELKILPCPFCGSETAPVVATSSEMDLKESEPDDYYAVCCNANGSGCGASGAFKPTKPEAISAWNGRAGK